MRGFLKGFGYAAKGFMAAVRYERNFRFHLCAAVFIYALAAYYPFGRMEYSLITILVAGVLALELVNSAIERVIDRLCPGREELAGLAKDMAAGAVLVFSIGAAVVGVLLFWQPLVLMALWADLLAAPACFVVIAAALALAAWFVFGFGKRKEL